MKKLMILALGVMIAANISAQEAKAEKALCKKEKKECKMSREQRIELDIKMLSEELYLSEEQEAKFAPIYREYMAEKAKLKEKYKAEFGKALNERQVKRVLHFHGPKQHPGFDKGQGPKFDKGQDPKFDKGPCPKECKKECKKDFKNAGQKD